MKAQRRRSAALPSAAGVTWRVRHCEGERNPSDYMSRAAADRGEIRPGEAWRGRTGGPRSRPERGDEMRRRAGCRVAGVMEVFSGSELSRSLTAWGLRATSVFPLGFDGSERRRNETGTLSLLSKGFVWLVRDNGRRKAKHIGDGGALCEGQALNTVLAKRSLTASDKCRERFTTSWPRRPPSGPPTRS